MQHVPFSLAHDEQTGVIAVAGDLEEVHLAALSDAVEAQDGPTTVDLTAVTYLPSYVLGALVGMVRDAEDEEGTSSIEIVAAAGSIAASVLAVVAIPHRLT